MDGKKTAIVWVLMVNTMEPEDYAELIARGRKSIEVRPWSTDHRGLLIIARKGKKGTKALAVVNMADCRPTQWSDVEDACLESYIRKHRIRSIDGYFSWIFEENTRIAKPFVISVSKQLSEITISEDECPEYFKMLEKS